jgi:hypothetical protein
VTYTAGGGTGGVQRSAGGAPNLGGYETGGSCTASSGIVDDPVNGNPSVFGVAVSTSIMWSGAGGSSRYGVGGPPSFAGANGSTAGSNASGRGAGGGGAVAAGTGAAAKGGDGTDGEVIIWEYN